MYDLAKFQDNMRLSQRSSVNKKMLRDIISTVFSFRYELTSSP